MPLSINRYINMLRVKNLYFFYTCITFLVFQLFTATTTIAQNKPASKLDAYINLNDINFYKEISAYTRGIHIADREIFTDTFNVDRLKDAGTPPQRNTLKQVTQPLVIKFNVRNDEDSTASVWFFPGYYFWQIEVYQLINNKLVAQPKILPDTEDSIGYRKLSVAPNDSATFVIELQCIKTHINRFIPRLIGEPFMEAFAAKQHGHNKTGEIVTYFLCGLLAMMVLYSMANYYQEGNIEFLYYSGYAFFTGLMLFTKAVFTFRAMTPGYIIEESFDFILHAVGIIFYMIFMRSYLNTKQKHPFLYKLYNSGSWILIVGLIIYCCVFYFTDNFVLQYGLENGMKLALLIVMLIFIVYARRNWNDKLMRYVFWGNLMLLIFSLLSLSSIVMQLPFSNSVFKSSVFQYEIGLFLELVFFLAALNYKNNRRIVEETSESERLKAENQRKEYEKELAVLKAQEVERQRISADMHDELGAGMTVIRLMSEMARHKMKEDTPIEIDKISQSADDVLNKMNAIIWSMNSGNDSLDNTVSYIRAYAQEYFENTDINLRFQLIPENLPHIELSGDKRRNIFLSVKESLNNILKHAHASEVSIKVTIDTHLEVTIKDNGKGINMDAIRRFGNGLNNIKRRMEGIGGTYEIFANDGTVTILNLPLFW